MGRGMDPGVHRFGKAPVDIVPDEFNLWKFSRDHCDALVRRGIVDNDYVDVTAIDTSGRQNGGKVGCEYRRPVKIGDDNADGFKVHFATFPA